MRIVGDDPAMRIAISLLFILAAGRARGQVSVTVDATADNHPVSALVFGINFADPAQVTLGKVPLTRWGGNTRASARRRPAARPTSMKRTIGRTTWSSARQSCSR